MSKEIIMFKNSDQCEDFYYGSNEKALEILKELNLTKTPIIKRMNPTKMDADFDVLFDGEIYENQFTCFLKEKNIKGFDDLMLCSEEEILDLYPVFHEWLKSKFEGITDLDFRRTVDGKLFLRT